MIEYDKEDDQIAEGSVFNIMKEVEGDEDSQTTGRPS